MCIRINNMLQLKEIHGFIYSNFNKKTSKYYNQLIKMSDRNTLQVFQQFKVEIYSLKLTSNNLQKKIDRIYRGLILLLVYRVKSFLSKAKYKINKKYFYSSLICFVSEPFFY